MRWLNLFALRLKQPAAWFHFALGGFHRTIRLRFAERLWSLTVRAANDLATRFPPWQTLSRVPRLARLTSILASWYSPTPFGLQGERAAERFLRRLGYTIVDRRARGGLGEIDLVAVDHRTIVFVEVKSRRSHQRGHPAEAVDPRKQRRLTRLALSWLKRHDLLRERARFDVVAITWPKAERSPTIKHIRNAFEAAGDGQMFC